MINKILLLLLIGFSFTQVNAQFIDAVGDTLFGNEWINHDQEYYKIAVAEDGIYRISYDLLKTAGISLESIKGENFQMFLNGEEYPIYTTSNDSFGEGDYIEFYARKNRGELDAVFYEDPETMQLNPEFSLFTDTAAYFITWNDGGGNLRVNSIVSDVSSSILPVEEFYMHKERLVQSNRIHKPTRSGGDNVRYSHFDVGEGFGGRLAKKNEVSINASNIYAAGDNPSVDIRFTSNATIHSFDFSINGDLKANWEHNGYALRNENVAFDVGDLTASNKITLEGTIDEFDRNILAVVDLNYPRTFDFDNEEYFEFFMSASATDRRVAISNFKGGSEAIVYDPATQSRITSEFIDGAYNFILPASTEDRTLVIYNAQSSVQEVESIEKMNFVNFAQMDHDYIIISHSRLMSGPIDRVAEYASYRSTQAGGSFNPVVVNVEDLYEQFSYGIHRHSYSIKNFVNWAAKNWTDPKYVFMIGKGREYPLYRTKNQIEREENSDFSIPTYGYPGSDNLLTSNGNNSSYSVLASGRLISKSPDDVDLYLQKIKEHENYQNLEQTLEARLWTKNIIHLSGGDPAIQSIIFNTLERMRNTIESNKFAGSVETLRKYSTDVIESSLSQGIKEKINSGVSIITFFGHSAVGTFDFSLEDPSNYENKGKYPFMIALGCSAGNIHSAALGVSEDFVLERDKGAIAFFASSGTAYLNTQSNFGGRLYEFMGGEFYGKSLGEAIRGVIKTWDDQNAISIKILMEQLTFHGDPAITLPNFEGPDFLPDAKAISTSPKIVSTNLDSFELSFDIFNLGTNSTQDSFVVTVEHFLPNGELFQTKNSKIPAPSYKENVDVFLATPDLKGLGKNAIEIRLDPADEIPEIPILEGERNNLFSNNNDNNLFEFFVLDEGVVPIYPEDRSIINSSCPFVLQASTNNLFIDERKYIFQIDTSATFNSTFLKQEIVSKSGGIVDWSPSFPLQDNEVYYWRVTPDSTNTEIGYLWEGSSFLYVEDSDLGWNSSHYYQYLDNEEFTYRITEDRNWEFVRVPHDMRFDLGINTDPGRWVYYDGQPFGSLNPTNIGSYLGIHPRNIYQWSIPNFDPASVGALPTTFDIYAYHMDKIEDRQNVKELIETFPKDTRVFIYTILRNENADLHVEDWAADSLELGYNIFSILEDLGATKVRDLGSKGTVPYLFVYDVGEGAVAELIGDDIYSDLEITITADWFADNGNFRTKKIGPAIKWDRLSWQVKDQENSDSLSMKIYGVSSENEDLLFEKIPLGDFDISSIDAKKYPEIKLELSAFDPERTVPQIDFLRIYYDGVSDIAVNTNDEAYSFNKDTLEQGEPLSLQLPIFNYSSSATDSIEATFSIVDNSNQTFTTVQAIEPLQAKSSNTIVFNSETKSLQGSNQLIIDLKNKEGNIEKYDLNNFGIKEFYVRKDRENPILDVRFDGYAILDGDIVSPKSIITVQLKDENEYLLLDDPDLVEIGIYSPSGNLTLLDINTTGLTFEPANSANNNVARFIYEAEFEEEGEYRLAVKGSDRTQNQSGDLNYEINFDVILDQKVSEVLNYPNPFSSSTQFVFTLTGEKIPSDIQISIMNVSGQEVRRIFKEELGPLRIGTNRTQFKFNGKDEYGNQLANGVYLYKVEIRDEFGERVEKFDTGLSSYFKNNLGKMVLLR